jgi:Leucine-rich repeat (LRR) protein
MFSMDEGDEKSSQDQFLEDLPRLQGLERINLDRTDVTDKGIAHIQNLPRLNSLGLYLCGVVKGDTISALSTCPNIQFLNIGDCAAFKSKNFAVFPKLPKLEEFQATHANINNESLKYLSLCKNLKIIDLRRDEAVTDEGLHILMSLKLLERLSLDGTPVTTNGVKSLAPLKIKFINIPRSIAESPADMAELKKALPGTSFSILKKPVKQVGAINDWFRN